MLTIHTSCQRFDGQIASPNPLAKARSGPNDVMVTMRAININAKPSWLVSGVLFPSFSYSISSYFLYKHLLRERR
jgi:hypothetical protein